VPDKRTRISRIVLFVAIALIGLRSGIVIDRLHQRTSLAERHYQPIFGFK